MLVVALVVLSRPKGVRGGVVAYGGCGGVSTQRLYGRRARAVAVCMASPIVSVSDLAILAAQVRGCVWAWPHARGTDVGVTLAIITGGP